MTHLEKYFTQTINNTVHYFLITLEKNYTIVVHGVGEETPLIKITSFENKETAEKAVNTMFLAKQEEQYKEVEKPEEVSIFSIAMAQLKTADLVVFEKGLVTLKTLVDIYYTRGKHPFVQFLGVKMKDESLVVVSILDEYLQKHINKLSSSVLISVFQMTLQNIYFNFEATSFVVEEIIKRKDLTAQLAVVTQFYEACEYYDAGHRFWSRTNQDVLIDTYFPKFESEALLKLLSEASGDMLNNDGGDGMDDLFAPALHNTEDPVLQQNILDVLEAYKKEYEEEEYLEEDYFEELLDGILESGSEYVEKGVDLLKKRKENREILSAAIEDVNLEKIEELLNDGAKLDKGLTENVIQYTLEHKNLSIIKLCKSKGVAFDVKELLFDAEEHVDVVIDCIESGIIDINYIDKESNKNLLFFVSENKNLLEVLLKKGVNVNQRDIDGNTILSKICYYARANNKKYTDVVKLLLEYKANPNASKTTDELQKGETIPLLSAVDNEAVEITKMLINASADVNAMHKNGNNPLIIAHSRNNTVLIDLLVQAGATAPENILLKIKFLRYAAKKEWGQVIEMEDAIILAYPNDFNVILNLAQGHYFYKSNYTQAVIYAKQALQLKANNSSLNILFMSLIRLGQVQSTIDIFTKHKKDFSPERILADNIIGNLVVAYCASGQLQEGLDVLSPYFSKVEESRKSRGVMSFNIACMYALLNDIHEMLPYVINALEREYTKADFLNDNDFANYHTNELFLFILNQDHKKNIELEEYIEDNEANTFKKLNVKAFYNTGSFSFENDDHEYSYETGNIGEKGRKTERLYTSKAQALTVFFYKSKNMSHQDKNMYFVLQQDDSLNTNTSLKAPKEVANTLDFLSGTEITTPIDTPITFATKAKTGDTMLDYYNGEIPVMSKRFIDLLKEAGVTTLQTFPIIIKSKIDDTVWENYFAVNILDVVACGAFPESIFKENKPKHGIRCELAIDTEKVDGAVLFRLKEYLPTIVLHRNVVKHIIDNDADEDVKWEFKGIIH